MRVALLLIAIATILLRERLKKRNEENKSKTKGKEIAEEVTKRIEHEMRWGRINKIMKEEIRNIA